MINRIKILLIVSLLLFSGSFIFGFNIIVFCVSHCSNNTLELLLKAGISPNQSYKIKSAGYHGDSHYGSALSKAADEGNIEAVQTLTRYGATLRANKPQYFSIRSPFVAAMQTANLDLIAFFIEHADNKASMVDYALWFSLSGTQAETIPYHRGSSCSKITEGINESFSNRSKMFRFIVDNFATNEQIQKVLLERKDLYNTELIDYLIDRGVFEGNPDLMTLYAQFPDVLNAFQQRGYDLSDVVTNDNACLALSRVGMDSQH